MDTSKAVLKAAAAIQALYEAHPVGGSLHIVVDDYNCETHSLAFCRQYPLDDLETACYEALLPLTPTQRIAAIALCDGYWKAA